MADNGLCECGCGQRTAIADRNRRSRRWIKGQPVPFIHGHNPTIPYPQRLLGFWGGFKTFPSQGLPDCVEWGRLVRTNGYGVSASICGERQVHRIAFVLTFGQPIPKDRELDHLCRNRLCANPFHLELVTRKVNSRRGAKAKLTQEQADAIKLDARPTRELVSQYNVSRATIKAIRRGAIWS